MATSQTRHWFRHGSWYAASSLLTAALSFLVLPVYVRTLGKTGLGQAELLLAGGTLLTYVIGQGLPAAWFRVRPQLFAQPGPHDRAFSGWICTYVLASGLVVTALGLLLGPSLAGHFTPDIPFYPLWLLAIVAAAAGVFGDLYAAGLQAVARSRAYAAFTILRRTFTFGVVLWLIVGLRWGVTGKLTGEALTALGMAAVVIVLLKPGPPTRPALPQLWAAVRYGLPVMPHSLAMLLVAMADRFVISHALGLSAVGVYALGYRIASVLETVNGSLGNAYRAMFMAAANALPEAPTRAAPHDSLRADALARITRSELWLLAAASLSGQGLALASRELLLVAGIDAVDFADAWRVTYIVCWGLFAHAAYVLLATPLFHAQLGTRRLPWISAAAALVNVLACVVYVPTSGILAAAWATAASHITLACGAWLLARELSPAPRAWRGCALLLTCHSLSLLAGWHIERQLIDTLPRLAAKASLLLAGCLCTLGAVHFGMRTSPRTARAPHPPA